MTIDNWSLVRQCMIENTKAKLASGTLSQAGELAALALLISLIEASKL
jgi:hypothetical protein